MRHQRGRAPSDDDGPSWPAWVTVRVLRHGVRPLIEWLPDTPDAVRLARRLVAGFLAVAGPPDPSATFRPVTVARPDGGRVRGEWVRCAPVRGHRRDHDEHHSRARSALVRAAGGDVRLRVWPGQAHVFQAMTALVPEASRALDEAASFVRERLSDRLEVS